MLGKELEATLNQAFRSAREQRHEFMTVEHLLLALLSNRDAVEVLRACGADVKQIEGELRRHLAETVPALAPGGGDSRRHDAGRASLSPPRPPRRGWRRSPGGARGPPARRAPSPRG